MGCLILLGSSGARPRGVVQGDGRFLGSSVGLLSGKPLCVRSHLSKLSLGVCDGPLHECGKVCVADIHVFQKVCVSDALSKVIQNPGVIPGGCKPCWAWRSSCSGVHSIHEAYVSCYVNDFDGGANPGLLPRVGPSCVRVLTCRDVCGRNCNTVCGMCEVSVTLLVHIRPVVSVECHMDSALHVPVTGMSLSVCLEDEDSMSVTLLVHIGPGASVVCHMYSALNIPVAAGSLSACGFEDANPSCGLQFRRPPPPVAGPWRSVTRTHDCSNRPCVVEQGGTANQGHTLVVPRRSSNPCIECACDVACPLPAGGGQNGFPAISKIPDTVGPRPHEEPLRALGMDVEAMLMWVAGVVWTTLAVLGFHFRDTVLVVDGGTASSRHSLSGASVDRELVQCSASLGTSPDIQAQCETPVHTSLQWQPAECIVFAASMAKQVAQRLSPHETLVDGVVARFVADLSRLADGAEDPGEAGSYEHEQWTSAYEYWWPVWWWPYQSASEPTFQAEEPAAGAGLVAGGAVCGGSAAGACSAEGPVRMQQAGGEAKHGAPGGEAILCEPCGDPPPQNQLMVCGGPASPAGKAPSRGTSSVVMSSPVNFLTSAEWGRVWPAARGLRGCGAAVSRPAFWEPVPDLQLLSVSEKAGAATECNPGLAVASREFVERCIGDALHGIKGWLDIGQVYEDMDVLQCAIWNGEAGRNVTVREEILKMYLRLSEFLEDAATIKGFWEEATSLANHEGEDFVQQAIGLGRGLPEWEAWEACEPLECEIMDFVDRVYARSVAFRLEVSGNFKLLAETVGDQILQVREWQQSLLSAEPELEGCYVTGCHRTQGKMVASSPRARK